jgi:hypothetical protein
MWILQILAPSLLRLGLLKVQKPTIPTLSISNTNVKVWVNVIPTQSIVIIHYVHQQNKYSHHILKCVDIALPSSTNTLPCYENELIGNSWIHNPILHHLYPWKEVFTMKTTKKTIPTSKWQIPHWKGYLGCAIPSYTTTKSHFVLCNMWNFMQYEKDYSLTLKYYTLIVWTNMVLWVHKESKFTNEFTRFRSEFLTNSSIAWWLMTTWYGKINSLTYEQLRNFEYFNYLILMI